MLYSLITVLEMLPLTNPVLKASLVESIVTAHLKLRFGKDVFYWKPDHEVDFLVFREG
jgi:hypothetical protein